MTKTMLLSTNFNDIFKSDFINSFTKFSVVDTLIAFAVSFAIGLFIYFIYKKTFSGVIYSNSFNVSLIAITMVTTLVILGVTSNVVLSLGMVGALSIVRFRTAVKDAIDIVYLFWAIAEGILCGAGLLPLAVLGAPIIGLLILVFSNKLTRSAPYLLVVKLDDKNAEKNTAAAVKKAVKSMKTKSKTVIGGEGIEVIYEVRITNDNTEFVNKLTSSEGVRSASLVSYDGNFNA